MNNDIKEIHLGKGLGKLVFDSTREQVQKILGKASEIERYSLSEMKGDETEAWHYDELSLSLSFDEENNWLLSSIAISSEEFLLDGKPLIGRKKQEVLAEFKSKGYGEPEEDEEISREDPESSLYIVEDSGISLWFEGDELTEAQLSVYVGEEE